MDEAQRTETEFGRTTPDGSYGGQSGQGGQGQESTQLIDKAKQQMEPGIEKAKEQLDTGMEKAREQADAGMDKAAEGLETAAGRIKSMTGQGEGAPAQAGVKLAEGMESAATYLKEHSSDEVLHDIEAYVKQHPTQALVGAVFAGFLFGRMLR